MVLTCTYPDCSNRLKTKRLRSLARTHSGVVTFHPARLKLWLIALWLDINTPINSERVWDSAHQHLQRAVRCYKHLLPHSTQDRRYGSPPETSDSDFPAETQFEEDTDGSIDLDVSMLSLDPPSEKKDVSFDPPTSTCTSSTTTTDEEEEQLTWKERKWIVNESTLMNLFRRCQECGALITKKQQQVTSGSLISIYWECEQRHKGQWNSCADLLQKHLAPFQRSQLVSRKQ
uniref:Zgc:158320 n=1 Tax=Sinocyclocheilus rhinocerous TaxID=307959 RepID=A0A673J966_9TELE